MIDYRTEWRTFGDKQDKQTEDQVRVGGPVNFLLTGGGLSTSLSKGKAAPVGPPPGWLSGSHAGRWVGTSS